MQVFDFHFETNCAPTAEHQQPTVWVSHFDKRAFDTETNICIGARVAISNVNILPEIGLYNVAIGTAIKIVYKSRPVGPNDKEHCHLPDYVVVVFPNLKLLCDIPPWDQNHKTASLIPYFNSYLFNLISPCSGDCLNIFHTNFVKILWTIRDDGNFTNFVKFLDDSW